MSDDVSNIGSAFARIAEPWQPHRLASLNDIDLKVVRLRGEFVWHTHPDTDELFWVRTGRLTIQLRNGGERHDVVLGPDDVFVVPRGMEHCPVTDGDVEAVLIEAKGTVNTGDAGGERTSPLRELGA